MTDPLVTYMTSEDRYERSAAFLRMYAARVRDRSAAAWEIPNSVASTLEDIANMIDSMARGVDGGQVTSSGTERASKP